jgi:outer membrane receptor protein involved in Fe transport
MLSTTARGQRSILACGVAAAAVLAGSQAWAPQARAQAAQAPSALEEVVVTATRQAASVNRVPLSITAATQATLDQQGVKNVEDLSRVTPGLSVSSATAGVANFTIRGVYSEQGAPTTGVYLDDVTLTKRATLGAAITQSAGTPAPPLFDLERVEVLRGPQGTLYGGSSEGGAIRYITTAPSLTRYSGLARAELSSVAHGGEGYSLAAAVGGPIVQDKLGFRAAAYYRKKAGYIDLVDAFNNGAILFKDANEQTDKSLRLSLLWRPFEKLTVNAAYYGSVQDAKYIDGVTTGPTNVAFTLAQPCFNPPSRAAVACGPGTYQRPGGTIGPFNYLNGFQSFERQLSPQTTYLDIGSLTVDYDLGFANFRSITAYLHDKSKHDFYSSFVPSLYTGTTNFPTATRFPLIPFAPDLSQGRGDRFQQRGRRVGWSEEVRLTSPAEARPISWVLGAYYSWNNAQVGRQESLDLDAMSRVLFGQDATGLFSGLDPNGARTTLNPLADMTIYNAFQQLSDEELAGFGEVNWRVTEQLKLIGGVRASKVSNDYSIIAYGPVAGYNVPTVTNGGYVPTQKTSETPVTPKFGVQYDITSNDMVYLSAAKGFRAGGANVPIPAAACATGLASQGLGIGDIPTAYGSDSVWSYEAGAKTRIGANVQLNSSVYRIDWSDVQLGVRLPGCSVTFVMNAGTARSQGFDTQLQAQFGAFSTTVSVAYTDAKYTAKAVGPTPRTAGVSPALIVNKGDKFPVPPWTVALSGQYNFQLGGGLNAYLRGDFQYASKYLIGFGPAVPSYTPDARNAESTSTVSVRGAVSKDNWELNVFANNLFDKMNQVGYGGGRSGCSPVGDAACSRFSSYGPTTGVFARPREIGAQVTYRY